MSTKRALMTSAFVVGGAFASAAAHADEGGLSFWLPGEFGSFAAVPGEPGPSIASFFYYPSVSASAGKEFFRGDQIVAGVQGRGTLVGLGPTYTFETPYSEDRPRSAFLASAAGAMD
jgi:hypothetical protein